MDSHFFFYGNWHSGHSYKVSLFASITNLKFNYHHIDTFCAPNERPDHFLKVSRYAEVPVIKWDNHWLCQSNSILLFLADKTQQFCANNQSETNIIHEWLQWEMSRLSVAVANLRIITKYNTESAHLKDYFYTKSLKAIDQLNHTLKKSDYLCGNQFTIADISCSAYLFLAEEANLNIKNWPYVNNWLNTIKAQPGWKHPYESVPHH